MILRYKCKNWEGVFTDCQGSVYVITIRDATIACLTLEFINHLMQFFKWCAYRKYERLINFKIYVG